MNAYRTLLSALILSSCVGVPSLSARGLDDLSYGADDTFEIITWNIEWFPKNGAITTAAVADVIEALDVDLLALQEISDTTALQQMVDGINGYKAYYQSSWPAGLAYVYKSDSIEIVDAYEIYTTQPYWSAFPRSPMVMELKYKGELVIVINNHFKCCGDGILDAQDPGDEETRRYYASNLLKHYIDTNLADERVIVLGDLNDLVIDTPGNNVFAGFLNDPNHYLFADTSIAAGSSADWSYPTWPSHLDHILITDELFPNFADSAADVRTIRIDDVLPGGWSEYDAKISDHRPVGLKIPLGDSGSSCPNELVATESVRVGTPANPIALLPGLTSRPVIGATWDPMIDHSTFVPAAMVDYLIIASQAANLASGNGTVLCDLGGPAPFLLFAQTPGVAFHLPLPTDCSLVGLTFCAQGASIGPASVRLTNALDCTIGTSGGP